MFLSANAFAGSSRNFYSRRIFGCLLLSKSNRLEHFRHDSKCKRPICDTKYRYFGTYQNLHQSGRHIVLGIETSCDDTGAAVVDGSGTVLGEALHSQLETHLEFGGILPPVARDLHKQHIDRVVQDALSNANMQISEVDAVAVTVKPGMAMSLNVGLDYAKNLVTDAHKPLIPIHHMEAHALTARSLEQVEFPFLVLLASGGHCLLAVARGVDDFLLIGKSLDSAPGQVLDKAARRLKLVSIPECSRRSGGAAVELMARHGNPRAFNIQSIMAKHYTCNFSFSGIHTWIYHVIHRQEQLHGVEGGSLLPNLPDVCAALQYAVMHHIAKRLQRALVYCDIHNLLPSHQRAVVLSGGVAGNEFMRAGLARICDLHNCRLVCLPPQLCTDNGVMIAWNGVEKLRLGLGQAQDISDVIIQPKCPLGTDITEQVAKENIKLTKIKLVD